VLVATRSPRRPDEVAYNALPDHADVVINLAGESILGYWTKAKKQRILQSRIDSTRVLVEWMAALDAKPSVFISASGIGIYGHRPGEVLNEDSEEDPRRQFRWGVCRAWEQEALRAESQGVRVVLLRLAAVLEWRGGMVKAVMSVMQSTPVVVPVVPGAVLSWISMTDTVRMIEWAMEDERVEGPLNAASPHSVSYREFTYAFATRCRKPVIGALPAWLARVVLGELSEGVVQSQDMRPAKALALGFSFNHPTLQDWLLATASGDD
jgi:uncharacterized protein